MHRALTCLSWLVSAKPRWVPAHDTSSHAIGNQGFGLKGLNSLWRNLAGTFLFHLFLSILHSRNGQYWSSSLAHKNLHWNIPTIEHYSILCINILIFLNHYAPQHHTRMSISVFVFFLVNFLGTGARNSAQDLDYPLWKMPFFMLPNFVTKFHYALTEKFYSRLRLRRMRYCLGKTLKNVARDIGL